MFTSAPTLAFEVRRLFKTHLRGSVAVEALSGVDLAVPVGEFVVGGSSGGGRAPLLHLLGGLDRPGPREVLFAGTDLAARSESERTAIRRHQLGFVFNLPTSCQSLSA
jgi:ABC-type lipoprotein export system ATPase subunit